MLVERGLNVLDADEFLMKSLLTATEVATVLGVKDSRAARDTLRRWGVKPIHRGPGRSGENAYPADLVWQHQQHRPGRGWRKGRSTSALETTNTMKENTMHAAAETTAPDTSEPWYSDHREVVALASILVDADWLSTPRDVVDFFDRPWKYDDQLKIWAAAGRPQPPSPDIRTQARALGQGTVRRELERRFDDDAARWEALIESFDAAAGSEGPAAPDQFAVADDITSNVRPLKSPRKSRKRG